MNKKFAAILSLAAAPMLASQTARADIVDENELATGWGIGAFIGGGVTGFTDADMIDYADDVAGAWETRLVFGTRRHLAFEAAYTGAGQGIDALGLESDAVLVSTGLEGAARLNFLTQAVRPYIVAGAGWRRYDVTGTDVAFSDIRDSANQFEIPLGTGVAFQAGRAIFDVRGMWRPAFGADLVESEDVAMHNWSATGRLGFEF